jgi:Homeodomain-like domain
MPWRECRRMDERLRFVARLLEGEKMAGLCREFGISRPTGYKVFNGPVRNSVCEVGFTLVSS